jgi:uncharacterized 2Fe-2S/4Fe-4S cluster protein (DUF4445 family)
MHSPTDMASRSQSLRFPQLDRQISAKEGESVFQSARRHGVRIVGACGGRGTCGTCLVRASEGDLKNVADEQGDESAKIGSNRWVRACEVRPASNCVLEVAPRSLATVVRAEIDTGTDNECLAVDPFVSAIDALLAPATISDNASDADRLKNAISQPDATLDILVARHLPEFLRKSEGDCALRAHIRNNEVISISAQSLPSLGLAIDLGTTNVAGFLLDLQSGTRLAGLGIENPQTAWGADLISRINYAIRSKDAAQELQTSAINSINALIHDLCRAHGTTKNSIVDAVVCGNTAMQHLLLGLPVRQLGRAPFVAAVSQSIDIKARDLGIQIDAGSYIHVAPIIGGFVGGDHVAALLATEPIWGNAGTCLVLDIGTNTEISLVHNGAIFSTSSPSGPCARGWAHFLWNAGRRRRN